MRRTDEGEGAGGPGPGDVETAAIEAVDTIGLLRPETFERRESPGPEMRRRWVAELCDLPAAPSDLLEGAKAACRVNYRVTFADLTHAVIEARNARERKEADGRDPFDGEREMFASEDTNIARIGILMRMMSSRSAMAQTGRPVGSPDEFERQMRREFSAAGVGLNQVPLTRPRPAWIAKKPKEQT